MQRPTLQGLKRGGDQGQHDNTSRDRTLTRRRSGCVRLPRRSGRPTTKTSERDKHRPDDAYLHLCPCYLVTDPPIIGSGTGGMGDRKNPIDAWQQPLLANRFGASQHHTLRANSRWGYYEASVRRFVQIISARYSSKCGVDFIACHGDWPQVGDRSIERADRSRAYCQTAARITPEKRKTNMWAHTVHPQGPRHCTWC